MTPEQLDAIQKRADAATDGPWFREYSDVVIAHPDPRDVEEGYEDARNARVVRGAPHLPKKDRQGIADANFIAAARTDVPALIAYARDLEARIATAKSDALREAAERFKSRSDTYHKTMQEMAESREYSVEDIVRYGAYSAEANTTAAWLRTRAALTATEGQA